MKTEIKKIQDAAKSLQRQPAWERCAFQTGLITFMVVN
jgi:hypothetical protein